MFEMQISAIGFPDNPWHEGGKNCIFKFDWRHVISGLCHPCPQLVSCQSTPSSAGHHSQQCSLVRKRTLLLQYISLVLLIVPANTSNTFLMGHRNGSNARDLVALQRSGLK